MANLSSAQNERRRKPFLFIFPMPCLPSVPGQSLHLDQLGRSCHLRVWSGQRWEYFILVYHEGHYRIDLWLFHPCLRSEHIHRWVLQRHPWLKGSWGTLAFHCDLWVCQSVLRGWLPDVSETSHHEHVGPRFLNPSRRRNTLLLLLLVSPLVVACFLVGQLCPSYSAEALLQSAQFSVHVFAVH